MNVLKRSRLQEEPAEFDACLGAEDEAASRRFVSVCGLVIGHQVIKAETNLASEEDVADEFSLDTEDDVELEGAFGRRVIAA